MKGLSGHLRRQRGGGRMTTGTFAGGQRRRTVTGEDRTSSWGGGVREDRGRAREDGREQRRAVQLPGARGAVCVSSLSAVCCGRVREGEEWVVCPLHSASLSLPAQLSSAQLSSAQLSSAQLSSAQLSSAQLSQLSSAQLTSAQRPLSPSSAKRRPVARAAAARGRSGRVPPIQRQLWVEWVDHSQLFSNAPPSASADDLGTGESR